MSEKLNIKSEIAELKHLLATSPADRILERKGFEKRIQRLQKELDANPAPQPEPQPAEKLDLAKFEGCTPGPWTIVGGHYPGFIEVIGPSFKVSIVTSATNLDYFDYTKRHIDARLIAAAPDLLTEVRESRETIAQLRQQVEEMRGAMQIFVDRCESGTVLSRKTYSDFKAILAKHEKARQPAEHICRRCGRSVVCVADEPFSCDPCLFGPVVAKHEQASEHGKEGGDE